MALEFKRVIDGVGYIKIPDSGGFSCNQVIGTPDDAMIVDAYSASESEGIIAGLEAAGFKPEGIRAIVVTHGHEDHYGSAAALTQWCKAPVWAHLSAATQIEDPDGYFVSTQAWIPNMKSSDRTEFRGRTGAPVRVGRILREGDIIEHAGMKFDVLHIPGHDRGEIALFESNRKLVFTGDLIQGGMDASDNWLGLFTDSAAQRRSLNRIAALKPEWNFKGHRGPRNGPDVLTDINCALARLDKIEAALIEALAAGRALTLAEATRAVFKAVLGRVVVDPPNYAWVSVNAFLLGLARQGLAVRNAELAWERAKK